MTPTRPIIFRHHSAPSSASGFLRKMNRTSRFPPPISMISMTESGLCDPHEKFRLHLLPILRFLTSHVQSRGSEIPNSHEPSPNGRRTTSKNHAARPGTKRLLTSQNAAGSPVVQSDGMHPNPTACVCSWIVWSAVTTLKLLAISTLPTRHEPVCARTRSQASWGQQSTPATPDTARGRRKATEANGYAIRIDG